MEFSHHAAARANQRSVPTQIVEAIFNYGIAIPAGQNCLSVMLDRKSLELAADELPAGVFKRLRHYFGVYLIVGENDRLVTIGRGQRRWHH